MLQCINNQILKEFYSSTIDIIIVILKHSLFTFTYFNKTEKYKHYHHVMHLTGLQKHMPTAADTIRITNN